jgi:hypothetical protein
MTDNLAKLLVFSRDYYTFFLRIVQEKIPSRRFFWEISPDIMNFSLHFRLSCKNFKRSFFFVAFCFAYR